MDGATLPCVEVISVDQKQRRMRRRTATGDAGQLPTQRTKVHPGELRSIHGRMEARPVTPGDRHQPTEFGNWLLVQMANAGLTQSELARQTGLAQATISRWIYHPGRPDPDKLNQLARALGVNALELHRRAGHLAPEANERPGKVVSAEPLNWPPIAAEIRAMLADDSPIGATDRDALATILDRVIDPYRRRMRRRKVS